MKKILLFLMLLSMIFIFPLNVHCTDVQSDTQEKIENEFYGSLDHELYNILEENGLDSLSPDKIFSEGTENIKNYFSETLYEKVKGSASWFLKVVCILLVMSVFSQCFDFSSSGDMFSLFSSLILTIVTVDKISVLINCVVSALSLNGKFMLSFIPVFTLLVSLSGNPSSALTYNSLVLFFCEIMSAFIDGVFVNFIGSYFALSIAFSFNNSINLSRFINSVNRTVTFILGFAASVFTGFLSLKNILAYSTDSVSVKGVKFLISSMIPVIGSSLSDAYSSVLGSIHLMKGSLGAIGVFALIIINIPPLLEGAVYCLLMSVTSGIAEVLGLKTGAEVLRCFSSCVRILLLVCLFQLFILIVSMGLMLSLKGA